MTDTRPEDRTPEMAIAVDPQPAVDTPHDGANPAQDLLADPTPPTSAPARRERRGRAVFFSLVLGGVIAAGLGFAAARLVPQGWPLAVTETDDAAQALDTRITALEGQVQTIAAREPATVAPDARLEGLAAELADLKAAVADRPAAVAIPDPALLQRLDALDQRLAGIEQAPAAPGGGVAPATFAALQAEVRALRDGGSDPGASETVIAEVQAAADAVEARLAEAEQRAQALTAATETATLQAARAAAIARLRSAIDTGLPFDGALADLSAAETEVPAALTDAAATGVPTLTGLRDGFPAAARAALDASRQADMGETFGQRMGSFLMNQTGARSLEPRAGTDPDAVLSRAEASLRAGDLPATLVELDALPPEGKVAVADWVAQAQGVIAARAAADELSVEAGN